MFLKQSWLHPVSQAVMVAPSSSIIYIKVGMYHENVWVTKDKINIIFIGDGINKTIITSNRSNATGFTTFYSATVDPRSSTGNLNVFAEIITELALSNMTDITTYISELYNKTTEPVMKEHLRICLALYQDGVPTLKKGLTSLKDKNYDDAVGFVGSGDSDAVNCGNQFSDPRNEELDRLCRIAITMIKNLGHIEKFTITSSP
ncbi:putative invertase inhibitor [Tasmannia lanceolata]|uniref:putative invertase inhibitor n=1 Tax=Tasmannia lanceolata TaxID=3420 RepID=UPI0040649F61